MIMTAAESDRNRVSESVSFIPEIEINPPLHAVLYFCMTRVARHETSLTSPQPATQRTT